MSALDDADDHDQLDRIRAAWEQYTETGDASQLEDRLAEHVVHLPPDDQPVAGPEALLADHPVLEGGEWEITDVDRIVSGDLAVERSTIRWTAPADDGGEPDRGTVTSVDAYRRRDDGVWRQILSVPLPDD